MYPISKNKSLLIRFISICLIIIVSHACDPSHEPEIQKRHQKAELLNDLPIQTVQFALHNSTGAEVNYELSLQAIAQLSSPTLEGVKIQACDVLLHEDQLIVAYNTQGENHHGAIQWIDVSQKQQPILRYELLLPESDVNRIRLYQGRYLIAATGEANSAARLEIFDLDTEPRWIASLDLPSYQANMLMLYQHYALVSSGDQGGVSVVDLTNPAQPQWVGYRPINHLRYVEAFSDQKLLLVTGGDQAMIALQDWPLSIEDEQTQSTSTTQSTQSARSARGSAFATRPSQTLVRHILQDGDVGAPTWGFLDQNQFYLSADRQGVLTFDVSTHTIQLQSQIATDGDANAAVPSTFGYTLLANGQEGLVVMDLSTVDHHATLAQFDVPGDQGSANAIALDEHFVVLADGLGGVKFLQTELQHSEAPGLGLSTNQTP